MPYGERCPLGHSQAEIFCFCSTWEYQNTLQIPEVSKVYIIFFEVTVDPSDAGSLSCHYCDIKSMLIINILNTFS